MAERRYLQLRLRFANNTRMEAQFPKIQKVIDANALDWLRFDWTTWVIWTDKTATDWYQLIVHLITQEDNLIIFKVNLHERFGWAEKWIWEWIDKQR